MSPSPHPLRTATGPLPPSDAAAVRALAAAALGADGVAPLNEATLLALGSGPDRRHLLAGVVPGGSGDGGTAGGLAGYAVVDTAEEPPTAELVVAARHRRAGLGRALLEAARAGRELGWWAHGDLPQARALAAAARLSAVRTLLRLRRPAGSPAVPVRLPDGIALAAFRPGADDAEWLRVNRAAFAGHPEQGRWNQRDLAERTGADWFDPAGLLLARRPGGPLLGSVWTKVTPDGPGGRPEGEVYVLGVDPAAQAGGLGTALAAAGLAAMAERGVGDVVLYVEGDSPAVRLYRRLGFGDDAVDVLWR